MNFSKQMRSYTCQFSQLAFPVKTFWKSVSLSLPLFGGRPSGAIGNDRLKDRIFCLCRCQRIVIKAWLPHATRTNSHSDLTTML